MKMILIVLGILSVLTGCGAAHGQPSYQNMKMEEAAEEMASLENFILVDVRTPEEYGQGHIPGAINIPNETIGKVAPAELPDLEQTIFVYCRSGNRSKQASGKLAELGYTNIIEIGGVQSWTGQLETQ